MFVGLEADTRASTENRRGVFTASLVLSQKHSHVSKQASIGLRQTARITSHEGLAFPETENSVFNIEIVGVRSHRIESLENVWAVKNTLFLTNAERDKGI